MKKIDWLIPDRPKVPGAENASQNFLGALIHCTEKSTLFSVGREVQVFIELREQVSKEGEIKVNTWMVN